MKVYENNTSFQGIEKPNEFRIKLRYTKNLENFVLLKRDASYHEKSASFS